MRFRNRLTLFLLALIGGVQIVTMAVVYSYARHAATEQGVRELALAGEALQQNLDIIAERVTTGVEVLALDFGLRTAIAEQDRATALSVLRNHGRRIKARRMMLVDLDGRVTADTALPDAPVTPFAFDALIEAAWLDGGASALVTEKGDTSWMIAAPIDAPETIAFVVAFAPVDSSLLAELSEASGAPVTISLVTQGSEPNANNDPDWRILAAGGDGARGANTGLSFDLAATPTGRTTYQGAKYLYAATPLSTAKKSMPIYALHEYRLTDVLAGNWSLFGPLLLILTGGLVVAGVGALTISSSVAAPLERLAVAAGALRGGEYNDRIGKIGGARELVELGSALDNAADAVRAREAALIETNVSLEAARDEAREADRAKSIFISNMSHELRTPLNAIIGFADVIRGEQLGPVGTGDYLTYANYIADGGRGLLDLHNAILDIARLESGKFDLLKDENDLREVVEDATDALSQMAKDKSVAVRFSRGDKRLLVDSDHSALVKALRHILHNAIKFTPENGSIAISVKDHGDAFAIVVRDTGIGMEEREIARLLRPFQRAHVDYSSDYPGAGLGLSIAQGVAALHGGRLSITSQPEVGTNVSLILPYIEKAQNIERAA